MTRLLKAIARRRSRARPARRVQSVPANLRTEGDLCAHDGGAPKSSSPVSSGRVYRRNFGFGVANGAMLMLGDTLIHPSLVLALFVSQISSSNLLVGLVPASAPESGSCHNFSPLPSYRDATGATSAVTSTIIRALSVATLGTIGFVIGDRIRTRCWSPSSSATRSTIWRPASPMCQWSMYRRALCRPIGADSISGSAAFGAACSDLSRDSSSSGS